MVIVKNWKLIYRWGILKELLEIKITSIIIYIIKQNNVNFFIILFLKNYLVHPGGLSAVLRSAVGAVK